MSDKKNNILALGNKDFNRSLYELKSHFKFNLETQDNIELPIDMIKYKGFIIHDDALESSKIRDFIKKNTNTLIFYKSKFKHETASTEQIQLPVSFEQINKIVLNSIKKKEFKTNSSLKIKDYILDKNSRKLVKEKLSLELTEKEIELIELLNKKKFIKKKEILSSIWNYSDEADTHTVETHIYRLRKKIKEIFGDESLIKSEKQGYTI